MTLELTSYILLTIACAFIVKGIAGFGDPLISNPLLAIKLDNQVITPALLPVSLIFNLYIVCKNHVNFNWRVVAPIAGWVLLGILPGTFLLQVGAPNVLKMVLGLLITALGVEMLTRDGAQPFREQPVIKAVVCFASGVCAGLFGINLLFLIYMERTAGSRHEFRANTCFIFLLDNLFRMIVYLFGGVFSVLSLQIAAITIPAAVIGMWIGSRIDRILGERNVRRVIIWVFILGGVSTLIKAL